MVAGVQGDEQAGSDNNRFEIRTRNDGPSLGYRFKLRSKAEEQCKEIIAKLEECVFALALLSPAEPNTCYKTLPMLPSTMLSRTHVLLLVSDT